MNGRFQWYGFSVARKHVYFYSALIAATLFASTIKHQLISTEPDPALVELHKLTEQVAEAATANY
jgi:hypothetical protein